MNPFVDLIDVASEGCGARVLEASDEFFAPKENLIHSEAPVFMPGKYTEAGKWMDGWESRRKRTPGHDWCVLQLGFPATLHAVDIDTSHFIGNFPSHASIDARLGSAAWEPVLAKMRLQGDTRNLFDLTPKGAFDHVRLNIFPDGGVARLRVYGLGKPDWTKLTAPVDLACAANGGLVLAASDMFFGSKNNLILPGRPANMGGGWETRRRRGPGFDWIIVHLGAPGMIRAIQVETEHYKGNYPESCSIDGCASAIAYTEDFATGRVTWKEILAPAALSPDAVHRFESELTDSGPFEYIRLNIYPDGGVSRLRVFGDPQL